MQAALPAIAVLLAGGLLILKLRARWQHRFGAPKSALLETPAYRALLVLVLFGGAKLPSLARSLGEARREFEKGSRDGMTSDKDEPRD